MIFGLLIWCCGSCSGMEECDRRSVEEKIEQQWRKNGGPGGGE